MRRLHEEPLGVVVEPLAARRVVEHQLENVGITAIHGRHCRAVLRALADVRPHPVQVPGRAVLVHRREQRRGTWGESCFLFAVVGHFRQLPLPLAMGSPSVLRLAVGLLLLREVLAQHGDLPALLRELAALANDDHGLLFAAALEVVLQRWQRCGSLRERRQDAKDQFLDAAQMVLD